MKIRSLVPPGLLAAAIAAAAAAQSSPSPLEKTRQARAQIDALLGPRRNAPPPPADPANPFAASGAPATPADSSPGNPSTIPATSNDQDLLARILKIGGTAMLNGRQQLIVNQQAYKEGDYIVVHDGDEVMRVRVLRIAPPSAVFEVNSNEVILRIRP